MLLEGLYKNVKDLQGILSIVVAVWSDSLRAESWWRRDLVKYVCRDAAFCLDSQDVSVDLNILNEFQEIMAEKTADGRLLVRFNLPVCRLEDPAVTSRQPPRYLQGTSMRNSTSSSRDDAAAATEPTSTTRAYSNRRIRGFIMLPAFVRAEQRHQKIFQSDGASMLFFRANKSHIWRFQRTFPCSQ